MAGRPELQLRASNISYRYRTSRALALDVDLTLRSGRTIILGPNGAGKSTLFGLCASRLRLQRGSISLQRGEQRLTSPHKHFRAQVGYMPQSPTFIKNVSAFDHLAYAAWLSGLDGAAAQKAASAWIHRVNLSAHAHKACGELSGGMQRRLAFAAASINSPAVILLDEPTAGLDPLERGAFREVVTSFDPKSIVLIATHQIDDLDLVADWIAVLSAGQIVFHDTVATFLDRTDPTLPQLARAEAAYASVIRQGVSH